MADGDATQLLRDWLKTGQELLSAHEGTARESALEDRLKAIEEKLDAKGVDADDLDEARVQAWLQKNGRTLADLDEPPAEPPAAPPAEPPADPPARPRQRLHALDIPRIHSGDDETDHVEYQDDDGKVQVRPGRKRGVPYAYDVEDVEETG